MLKPDDMPLEVREVPSLIAQLRDFIGVAEFEAKLIRVERILKVTGPVAREYWHKPNAAIWLGIAAAEGIRDPRALLESVSPVHEAARIGAILRILEPSMPDWKRSDIRSRLLSDDVPAPTLIELTVASRYAMLGLKIKWIEPDPGGGRRTPDLLVQGSSGGFEIECKAKTIDAGRKIARSKLYELCDHFPRSVLSRPFVDGFRAIDVRIPGRMPASSEWQRLIVSSIDELHAGGSVTFSDGTRLRVSVRSLGNPADSTSAALELSLDGPFVQRVHLSDDRDVFARPILVLRLWSEQQDRVVADIREDLTDALKQLSGDVPANIVCYVPEVTSFQGCQNHRSAIATMSRSVFAQQRANRLASIDFVSDPVVRHIPSLSVGMHVDSLRFQNYRIDPTLIPPELMQ